MLSRYLITWETNLGLSDQESQKWPFQTLSQSEAGLLYGEGAPPFVGIVDIFGAFAGRWRRGFDGVVILDSFLFLKARRVRHSVFRYMNRPRRLLQNKRPVIRRGASMNDQRELTLDCVCLRH